MKGNGLEKNILPCLNCDLDLWDMSLSQGHDTIAWYIIRIHLCSDNLWPGHSFGYVCTVTMNSEIWPWVKVMTHPSVIDNKCVKYYPDPTWPWGVMARTRISGICALWPWLRRYDNGSRSWQTLGSWTTIVWNIIQIQQGSEELWPRQGFPVYVHCDLDLGDMTLGQVHDTTLGHGQQLCEILSRSNLAVRSYGPDTDFQYMCTVTLTLEIWPWVKVMTHPWVMDNNCVKYYPDPTWLWGVMARTQISSMYALWPWPWRYDLGSRSWHTLGSWTTIVWIIIQIHLGSEELWPGHGFPVCVQCDLDLGDVTLRLKSRSWHTLGSWTTIVWNYIQIGQGSTKLWPGHDVNRRTDRQGDSYIPPPPQLCLRGV